VRRYCDPSKNDATTHAARLLAFLDDLFGRAIDRLFAVEVAHLGGDSAQHPTGDVFDIRRHEYARAGTGRQLLIACFREKTVGDQIALRRRVELQRSESAVMIRDDQSVGRDE